MVCRQDRDISQTSETGLGSVQPLAGRAPLTTIYRRQWPAWLSCPLNQNKISRHLMNASQEFVIMSRRKVPSCMDWKILLGGGGGHQLQLYLISSINKENQDDIYDGNKSQLPRCQAFFTLNYELLRDHYQHYIKLLFSS